MNHSTKHLTFSSRQQQPQIYLFGEVFGRQQFRQQKVIVGHSRYRLILQQISCGGHWVADGRSQVDLRHFLKRIGHAHEHGSHVFVNRLSGCLKFRWSGIQPHNIRAVCRISFSNLRWRSSSLYEVQILTGKWIFIVQTRKCYERSSTRQTPSYQMSTRKSNTKSRDNRLFVYHANDTWLVLIIDYTTFMFARMWQWNCEIQNYLE